LRISPVAARQGRQTLAGRRVGIATIKAAFALMYTSARISSVATRFASKHVASRARVVGTATVKAASAETTIGDVIVLGDVIRDVPRVAYQIVHAIARRHPATKITIAESALIDKHPLRYRPIQTVARAIPIGVAEALIPIAPIIVGNLDAQ
jgi:hypothetical protein